MVEFSAIHFLWLIVNSEVLMKSYISLVNVVTRESCPILGARLFENVDMAVQGTALIPTSLTPH